MRKLGKFYQGGLVTLVVIVTISLIALTQNLTSGTIETQRDFETVELLQEIFPKAHSYILKNEIYVIYSDRLEKLGYAFYVKGMGYNNWFNALVGLENETMLQGIVIIYHGEHVHSGYTHQGPLADLSGWSLQFTNLSIKDCYLTDEGGLVDAISTATIGTRAITNTIREAALAKTEVIEEWSGET
jgi:Na+-translocating ferredoxin:NAD+ oxidoreductase RnfG subunit